MGDRVGSEDGSGVGSRDGVAEVGLIVGGGAVGLIVGLNVG